MFAIKVLILLGTLSNTFALNVNLDLVNDVIQELRKTIAEIENNATDTAEQNPDVGLNIYQYLRRYDYPVETHWVKTEDGYVLRMQRLVGGKNGTFLNKQNKPAVLIMHGLMSSAMDFVNMGPNRSLALILADAGYDVWLGNNRGNTWSRMHVTMNPDTDEKFWDFSFETCGFYDLPAKIDYIIEKTGQEKIFYIGHSQGTTQFFAMASLRPEYNNKIALMSALAPVGYMNHMSGPLIRTMANYMSILKILLVNIFHVNEILPSTWLSPTFGKIISSSEYFKELVAALFFMLCGFSNKQLDRSIIPVVISNTPAGISTKMLLHYGQVIRSGKFRRYDYGILNLKYYKSVSPPEFNVSVITAPVAMYYSQNDFFAAVQDVERFASKLPNMVNLKLIEDKRFNHLDFIFAKDVNSLVHEDLLKTQNEYIPTESSSGVRMFTKSSLYVITYVVIFTAYF